MAVALDISGQTYGYLTALVKVSSKLGFTTWMCKCICGKEVRVETRHLRNGEVKSCGCKTKELQSLNSGTATHRLSKTRTYTSWKMMLQRCYNPNNDCYAYYGGRGISVCDEWLVFENFLHDMGIRPPDLTLDRIDSDGNYCKNNCRWATRSQQVDNRRNGINYIVNGVIMSLKDLALLIGTTREKLYNYLYRGYSINDAVKTLSTLDNTPHIEKF